MVHIQCWRWELGNGRIVQQVVAEQQKGDSGYVVLQFPEDELRLQASDLDRLIEIAQQAKVDLIKHGQYVDRLSLGTLG